MSNDLAQLFSAQEVVRRWKAERENAEARLELARAAESRAVLLSGHEPVHSMGINRESLRALLAFTVHHDQGRLDRDLAAIELGARS